MLSPPGIVSFCLFSEASEAPVVVYASSLKRVKSIAMCIDTKVYERLKFLSPSDWRKICSDLLGVEVQEVTVHEGEAFNFFIPTHQPRMMLEQF